MSWWSSLQMIGEVAKLSGSGQASLGGYGSGEEYLESECTAQFDAVLMVQGIGRT